MSRRVLFIVENLPVPFDRRVWQEATTLRSFGYQVAVICPTGKGCEQRSETIDGVDIYRHPLPLEGSGLFGFAIEYAAALFWEFVLALKVHYRTGFDAIHACNPPDNIFVIGAFFKLLGKRFVFDHHDICPELYEAKFSRKGFFHKVALAFERWTFRVADLSIATNESYKRIAIERGGMDPSNVFVVRSGPDLQRLRRMPPADELKCGRRFLVGYVGVMGKQEGIDLLLRSVAHVVHTLKRHDVHFGLVGGGPELDSLRRLARELHIDDWVTFTGRVTDDEMLAMLSTADVCVNPDVANEMNDKSTMNKIMEYMALGKPIVQFDLTEGRVSAGLASVYANRNDIEDFACKILELLDNSELRARMGKFGYERVLNELEWSHEAPKLLAAYEQLFAAPDQ